MYAWKITSALINYVKEKLPSWEIPQRGNFFYAQPILIRNCRQKCGESNLIQLQRVTLLVYVLQYLSHCTARLQLHAVSPNHELTFPFKSIKISMHVPHLKQGTYTARTVCPHESWWRGVSTANQKIEQLKPRYDRQTNRNCKWQRKRRSTQFLYCMTQKGGDNNMNQHLSTDNKEKEIQKDRINLPE